MVYSSGRMVARPVLAQQNKHGRVSNVGRVASLFLFKKLAKQVQNQIFSGHLSPLSRLL